MHQMSSQINQTSVCASWLCVSTEEGRSCGFERIEPGRVGASPGELHGSRRRALSLPQGLEDGCLRGYSSTA